MTLILSVIRYLRRAFGWPKKRFSSATKDLTLGRICHMKEGNAQKTMAPGNQSETDVATIVARELQAELKSRLEKLFADPNTPKSFFENFEEQ